MFSVHPPESTQLKLYMPLTASFYARNEWGDWMRRVRNGTAERFWIMRTGSWVQGVEPGAGGGGAGPHALVRQGVPDVKVRSAVFTAEARGGRLWGVAECRSSASSLRRS